MRPFTLLQRSLALRRVPAAGSTLLACIFETVLVSQPARSAAHSRPRSAFLFAKRGTILARHPLPAPDPGTFRSPADHRSPPGRFHPSGSQHAVRQRPKKPTMASCPICLRSAPRRNNLTYHCTADQRSGSATSRLARCPHLRLYRRWITESPRCSHHSAVPTYRSLSFPKSRPFGIADDSLSELPRTLNPPAPIDGYPSYLGSRTIRFTLVESPGCPRHSPSATAIDQFPGCPKSWVSHRSPIPRASSCPESWFLG